MKNNSNKGFVGLFLLMIGVVLIITFIVRTDIFTGGDKGVLERGTDAINDANEVKKNLESKYRFDLEEQERSIDDLN
jgi:hypothetical protein